MNVFAIREFMPVCVCVTVYLCVSVGGCIKSSSQESAAKIIKITQCITDGWLHAE